MTHISWQQYGSEYVYPDGPDGQDEQDRYWRCRCGAFLPDQPTGGTVDVAVWVCKRCGKCTVLDETSAPPLDGEPF